MLIFFFEFIHQITTPIQIILFFTSVQDFKCKKLQG